MTVFHSATRHDTGRRYGYKQNVKVNVTARLHKLSGNAKAHFSVTCDIYSPRGKDIGGGADHETILRLWPRLADFVALHLSDEDGEPMHAAANGFYWMAGIHPDGFGERYHGGNQEYVTRPCAQIAADHFRVSLGTIAKLYADMCASENPRAVCDAFTDEQRPRWKAEAEAIIAKYGEA